MQYPDADFAPPWWLRNAHLQSTLASTVLRRPEVLYRSAALRAAEVTWLLDCGAGVRLQCLYSAPPVVRGNPVVLLHGWEGSADSLYILSLAQLLFANGFPVLRLNLRDHGDTHHLNRDLFHSCLLPEVVGAVAALNARLPGRPLQLIGYSLGGNFMLRVAAERERARLELARVIAVSPVLDPGQTLHALEQGWFAYHHYFVRKWTRSLLKKQAAWPDQYDFGSLDASGGLRAMTAELVRRFTHYGSLDDYLSGYALIGARLAALTVPALIVTALDDPIIPAHALERLARPPQLRLLTTRHGGHCGFLERPWGPTWVERLILFELTQTRADEPTAVPESAPLGAAASGRSGA